MKVRQLPPIRDIGRFTRSSNSNVLTFIPKRCKTTTYQQSLFIRVRRTWHIMPGNIRHRNVSLNTFRKLLLKGELRPEISLSHIKVLILIKAKSNVFLWYVPCCSCTRRSKTKILTTRAPPSWIDVVTSQRQTQSASDCVMLLESITWDSQTIFLAFTRDQ